MATAVAAFVAKARREVDNLFWDNNAFSPDRAVDFDAQAPIQRNYLNSLIAQGIVHELEPGRYWFDLRAYKELRRQQFVWTMRILAVAAVILIIGLVIEFASRS